jgi:hypothetical protein
MKDDIHETLDEMVNGNPNKYGNILLKRYGQKYERLDKELDEEAGSAAYKVCACVDK